MSTSVAAAGRARSRQHSLAEMALFVALASVLAGVLLHFLATYQEMAEKAAVEMTVRNIRASLRYRQAELLLHGQERDIGALVNINPMVWVGAAPPNYVGERADCSALNVSTGTWCFDRSRRLLVYRIARASHFSGGGASDKPVIEFQVDSERRRDDKSEMGQIESVVLVQLQPYNWF